MDHLLADPRANTYLFHVYSDSSTLVVMTIRQPDKIQCQEGSSGRTTTGSRAEVASLRGTQSTRAERCARVLCGGSSFLQNQTAAERLGGLHLDVQAGGQLLDCLLEVVPHDRFRS